MGDEDPLLWSHLTRHAEHSHKILGSSKSQLNSLSEIEQNSAKIDVNRSIVSTQIFRTESTCSGRRNSCRDYSESVIEDIKKRALHRSRILTGQLKGIEKMIENEDYCIDILTQSLAVQKSLGSLNKLLVENHLKTHVTEMFDAGGEEREAAIAELLKVYELSNNRG